MKLCAFLMMLASTLACGSDEAKDELPTQTSFGGERPAELRVPQSYDGKSPLPLLVVLHGHSVNGLLQLAYTRLSNLVEKQGVLVIAPDGLVNEEGNGFWNATASCCDFYGSGVDDAGYIRGLIDEVAGVYNVDKRRVFLWGHSNGGFMSYRMACDHADVIAGIVSLAGATYTDSASCNPSEPVNILQIHGDLDDTVLMEGGEICDAGQGCSYPGVEETLAQWEGFNGCGSTRTTDSVRIDLDSSLEGVDTRVEHTDGCPAGTAIDLWVIEGGVHIPPLSAGFEDMMWEWMSAHPKAD
jgi:polyhydroxybutyrate depolymerase